MMEELNSIIGGLTIILAMLLMKNKRPPLSRRLRRELQ
jgi:hypothetical protein